MGAMQSQPKVVNEGHSRAVLAPSPAEAKPMKAPEGSLGVDAWDMSTFHSEPLKLMTSVIKYGDGEAMTKVGRKAIIMAGEGTVLFVPVELYALAWAAKTFGARVETLNDAPTIDPKPVFAPRKAVRNFAKMPPAKKAAAVGAAVGAAVIAL